MGDGDPAVETMPGWLQASANNSPYTAAIDAIPALAGGGPVATDLWHAAWTLGLLLAAVPLATRFYHRAS